jgi:hypothetical protein
MLKFYVHNIYSFKTYEAKIVISKTQIKQTVSHSRKSYTPLKASKKIASGINKGCWRFEPDQLHSFLVDTTTEYTYFLLIEYSFKLTRWWDMSKSPEILQFKIL